MWSDGFALCEEFRKLGTLKLISHIPRSPLIPSPKTHSCGPVAMGRVQHNICRVPKGVCVQGEGGGEV